MTVFVSLFRAINVGKNKVGMPQLKEIHARLGFENPRHYLQTGNIVFESAEMDAGKVSRLLKEEFVKEFGFGTEVMVRTAAELEDIHANNPWAGDTAKETKWVVVMFLSGEPSHQDRQALTSAYTGPEEIIFSGKEIFIYYVNNIGESKLTNAYMEKKLKVLGTGRNWNTVNKLLEMTRAGQPAIEKK